MKFSYIVPGLLLAVGLILSAGCGNNPKKDKTTSEMNADTSKNSPHKPAAMYEEMRNMALGMTANDLKIQLPDDQVKIYGVVMDWDLGKGTATLVSFLSGDASLYLSSGGGVIGGGSHDNIKRSVTAFISKAEQNLSKATKTETTPLPEKNGIRFYFLTNKGKFVAADQMRNIEDNSSELFDLFEEANKVISEIRLSSPNK